MKWRTISFSAISGSRGSAAEALPGRPAPAPGDGSGSRRPARLLVPGLEALEGDRGRRRAARSRCAGGVIVDAPPPAPCRRVRATSATSATVDVRGRPLLGHGDEQDVVHALVVAPEHVARMDAALASGRDDLAGGERRTQGELLERRRRRTPPAGRCARARSRRATCTSPRPRAGPPGRARRAVDEAAQGEQRLVGRRCSTSPSRGGCAARASAA